MENSVSIIMIKLSKWAKLQGITYRTAWNWVKSGKMPEEIKITPSGSIFVIQKVAK